MRALLPKLLLLLLLLSKNEKLDMVTTKNMSGQNLVSKIIMFLQYQFQSKQSEFKHPVQEKVEEDEDDLDEINELSINSFEITRELAMDEKEGMLWIAGY